jgi:antitoxin VapB
MMVQPVLFILNGLQAVRLPKAAAFADQVHEVMIIPDVPRRIIAPADAVNRH